jgi:hypothetical protein
VSRPWDFGSIPACSRITGGETRKSSETCWTMKLPAGARLGPYQLLGRLGTGGMGEVYKAWDTRLDRTVAIKVLPEQFASDPDRRGRFEREARALRRSTIRISATCTMSAKPQVPSRPPRTQTRSVPRDGASRGAHACRSSRRRAAAIARGAALLSDYVGAACARDISWLFSARRAERLLARCWPCRSRAR